ncbi:Gfo/Idh/MocA family protein [Brevibacillus sp. NRS-1366]|uniref:Gfo/Idh/MocA family protein n=1 Tax=Brevibacillus sp. NRS-1366 TaxID=3233899 RepID=UPI003D262ECE
MNIAILGTGFGSYHVRLLKNMVQVDRVVVFGRNESKLETLREELGVEVTNRINEIMDDPDIDVIDICLPSPLHRQFAVEALNKGKHVICETPVCLDLEDARAMKQAEKQSGKRILVNQFIKFEPAYCYLRSAIEEQTYGKLLSLTLKRETAPLWGDLGLASITTNLMIHELDFVTAVMGSTDDMTVWGTESQDKRQALVRACFKCPEAHTEIVASSQMPASYPFTVSYEAYFDDAKLVFHERDANGNTHTALYEHTASGKQKLALEPLNPYEKSLEHAIHCFQNHTEPLISLDHALQSLEIAIKLKKQLVK